MLGQGQGRRAAWCGGARARLEEALPKVVQHVLAGDDSPEQQAARADAGEEGGGLGAQPVHL